MLAASLVAVFKKGNESERIELEEIFEDAGIKDLFPPRNLTKLVLYDTRGPHGNFRQHHIGSNGQTRNELLTLRPTSGEGWKKLMGHLMAGMVCDGRVPQELIGAVGHHLELRFEGGVNDVVPYFKVRYFGAWASERVDLG